LSSTRNNSRTYDGPNGIHDGPNMAPNMAPIWLQIWLQYSSAWIQIMGPIWLHYDSIMGPYWIFPTTLQKWVLVFSNTSRSPTSSPSSEFLPPQSFSQSSSISLSMDQSIILNQPINPSINVNSLHFACPKGSHFKVPEFSKFGA
jgi:hypothetical protein